MSTLNKEEVLALRKEFWNGILLSIGILTALHFLPKPDEPEVIRFVFTIAFFGSLLNLIFQLLFGLEGYLTATYRVRFQDCGPALEANWKLMVNSVISAVRFPLYALAALGISWAAEILALWISPLQPVSGLLTVIFWPALLFLVAYPFMFRNSISECRQRYGLLQKAVATGDFEPRTMQQVTEECALQDEPAVSAGAPWEFRAGGFDWRWQDFMRNGIIFGQPGTGKTSTVLNALLDGLLASGADPRNRPSGLILDPKGDFKYKIRNLCAKYGRENDLVVIDPSDPGAARWNPLDVPDGVLQVAARYAAVMQSTGMKPGDETFWIDSAKKFVAHAIDLIRLATPEIPPTLVDIGEMAISSPAIGRKIALLDPDNRQADVCVRFFSEEWPYLAEDTRSAVIAHITNMTTPFMREPYATAFSGKSTARILEMVDAGKIQYVHMPIAAEADMARIIGTFIKLTFHAEVLKRLGKERPSFFLCDEFQAFFTTVKDFGDTDFFERSRQSNHANIIATQNLPALLNRTESEHAVNNLLGNCAVKLFLRNTDSDTNEYASGVFGQVLVDMSTTSASAASGLAAIAGISASVSSNRQYDAKVRQEAFVDLAVPDNRMGIDHAESLLHLSCRGKIIARKLSWKLHLLNR